MCFVENGIRMQPERPFYYRLLLEPEMDSNLTWIRSPTWLVRPYLPPKVVATGRTSKGFLYVFSISLGHAPTWARVPRVNNKPMMTT